MKIAIVGGVAGGASTAARLRRMDEHAEISLFEKGAHISYANCGLPYYVGDVITDRNRLLVQTAEAFRQRFNIAVNTESEVTAIHRDKKTISVRNLRNQHDYEVSYDKLVLATGAAPIRLPVPGIDSAGIFTLRNVQDTDKIKNYINEHAPKKAVVIGAGFIGLEMAENLHHLGLAVTIIETGKQVLPPVDFAFAAFVQQDLRAKGVQLMLNSTVSGFEVNDEGLRVQLQKGVAIAADIVVSSVGVRPDTKLAADAGLALGKRAGILVNEYLQTSDPSIYALGDSIEFPNPLTQSIQPTYLAGPANKQGRICADNIAFGNIRTYKGSINTAIVKIFDLTVATAGLSCKQLAASGMAYDSAIIHASSHAGYYPGASLLMLQISFSPKNGLLYGAQIVGKEGVDKRIDVLSAVISRGGSIYDLADFEQAYAPPYSSAKDPVNMIGFVAENILQQKVFFADWEKLNEPASFDIIVDVRSAQEYAAGHVAGAIHIPLDEIRRRLTELPKDKTIFLYCQQGLRGYLAQRILLQNGFDKVANLAGGYRLYEICEAEKKLLPVVEQE